MPYNATVYNVMIASPGDVPNERNIVRDVVHEWNTIHSRDRNIVLLPVGWETHSMPTLGDRPQKIINDQILKHADLLVAVFWTRLGTPTGEAPSGTIEEIEEHLAANKPAMIYFSSAPVRPDSVDEEQYSALRQFKADIQKRGLYETYDTVGEFREKFTRQLSQTVIEHFENGEKSDIPDDQSRRTTVQLGDAATELLIAASEDQHGTVMVLNHLGGMDIQTNSRNFITERNARIESLWKDAVQELVGYGLLEDRGYKGEVFRVTTQGYDAADQIKKQSDAG